MNGLVLPLLFALIVLVGLFLSYLLVQSFRKPVDQPGSSAVKKAEIDPFLSSFISLALRYNLPPLPLWVNVHGVIITGSPANFRNFVQQLYPSIPQLNYPDSHNDDADEGNQFIVLSKATITVAGFPKSVGLVRIRLSDVSAWGFN